MALSPAMGAGACSPSAEALTGATIVAFGGGAAPALAPASDPAPPGGIDGAVALFNRSTTLPRRISVPGRTKRGSDTLSPPMNRPNRDPASSVRGAGARNVVVGDERTTSSARLECLQFRHRNDFLATGDEGPTTPARRHVFSRAGTASRPPGPPGRPTCLTPHMLVTGMHPRRQQAGSAGSGDWSYRVFASVTSTLRAGKTPPTQKCVSHDGRPPTGTRPLLGRAPPTGRHAVVRPDRRFVGEDQRDGRPGGAPGSREVVSALEVRPHRDREPRIEPRSRVLLRFAQP
jgi:hypothetical protein